MSAAAFPPPEPRAPWHAEQLLVGEAVNLIGCDKYAGKYEIVERHPRGESLELELKRVTGEETTTRSAPQAPA